MMTFKSMLCEKETDKNKEYNAEKETKPKKEKVKDIPSIIRNCGIKIKSNIPTNFGTEYILAKKYTTELEELIKILEKMKSKDYIKTYKIKDNSLFIVQ